MRPIFPLLALLLPTLAQAWGNHSPMCYRAFERMPEVANAAPVTAEPLVDFLRSQEAPIAALLDGQEAASREHLKTYAPRPEALRFTADARRSDADRRAALLRALRLSPQSRLALYLQPDPREPDTQRPPLDAALVTAVKPGAGATQRFIALSPGEAVAPLAVLASACDEPDYGHDLNLFDDNPGHPGYGFGRQPFGNPAVAIGSQAPFHMGFFHQGAIFDMLAPGFTRSFVEMRVMQYAGLAQLAWRSGHAYWGWRFAGMALHHIEDLTQPYHASAAPGATLGRMLWANLQAGLGAAAELHGLVVLQGNRHFVLEKFQTNWILDDARQRRDGPLELALRDASREPRCALPGLGLGLCARRRRGRGPCGRAGDGRGRRGRRTGTFRQRPGAGLRGRRGALRPRAGARHAGPAPGPAAPGRRTARPFRRAQPQCAAGHAEGSREIAPLNFVSGEISIVSWRRIAFFTKAMLESDDMRHDLTTLNLVLAIEQTRSITRGAAQEHLALAAASKRLSDLESRLGVQLFERRARGVEPTEAGRALVRHIRSLHASLYALETEVMEFSRGIKGHLRIAANSSAITEALPPHLVGFSQAHGQIRISLEDLTSAEAQAAVAEGRADVGVFSPPLLDNRLQTWVFAHGRLAALVPLKHPLAQREEVTFDDLLAYDLIGLHAGASAQELMREQAAARGRTLNARWQVRGFDAIAQLVEAGLGVAVLPEQPAERFTRVFGVRCLRLEEPWAEREYVLGVLRQQRLPTVVQRFVDTLIPRDKQ